MSKRIQPKPHNISKLLTGLLGREVVATAGEQPIDFSDDSLVFATYANNSGLVEAACVCDMTAAASLGAALSLFPANRVRDSVAAKRMDEGVRENLYEVCNVMVNLFNLPNLPSLSLTHLYANDTPRADRDLASLLESLTTHTNVDIDVAGYGAGKLSCWTA